MGRKIKRTKEKTLAYGIPAENTRPSNPRDLKSFDRKSADFYIALSTAYNAEANSLENSPERFKGKALMVRTLKKQADYHYKMAQHQLRNDVNRRWVH